MRVLAVSYWISFGWLAHARADVLPTPGRPSWPDTPLPMPGEPPELAIVALVAALILGAGLVAAHGRRPR